MAMPQKNKEKRERYFDINRPTYDLTCKGHLHSLRFGSAKKKKKLFVKIKYNETLS